MRQGHKGQKQLITSSISRRITRAPQVSGLPLPACSPRSHQSSVIRQRFFRLLLRRCVFSTRLVAQAQALPMTAAKNLS